MTTAVWNIPRNLLSSSIEIMRPHGVNGNEGIALWFGTEDRDKSISITHVVELHGSGLATSPLYLRLSFRAVAQLTDIADKLNVYLVGQIHSHPGRMTDLSNIDRAQGFRIPDFLSVVCPYYAQNPNIQLHDCGINVFEKGAYRRLPGVEIAKRIRLTNSQITKLRCEVHRD